MFYCRGGVFVPCIRIMWAVPNEVDLHNNLDYMCEGRKYSKKRSNSLPFLLNSPIQSTHQLNAFALSILIRPWMLTLNNSNSLFGWCYLKKDGLEPRKCNCYTGSTPSVWPFFNIVIISGEHSYSYSAGRVIPNVGFIPFVTYQESS